MSEKFPIKAHCHGDGIKLLNRNDTFIAKKLKKRASIWLVVSLTDHNGILSLLGPIDMNARVSDNLQGTNEFLCTCSP